MADLHETLEKRERRSRLVSFLVGSAIILAIVVGVVWFNNRNDNGEVVDEGVNITATEDSSDADSDSSSDDSGSDSQEDNDSDSETSDADTPVASGSNDSDDASDSGDEDIAADEEDETDDQQAVVATGGAEGGELPNTGPEHAVVGLIGVVVAAHLFVKTRSKLNNTLQS